MERDDPLLFTEGGEFVDVVEQLMGVEPGEAAAAFNGERAARGGAGGVGIVRLCVRVLCCAVLCWGGS